MKARGMKPTLPIATVLAASMLVAVACASPDDTPAADITPAPTSTEVEAIEPTITQPPTSTSEATVTPLPTSMIEPAAGSPEATEEKSGFRPGPEDIITLLPYDAIKAILEPRHVDVEWANQQMTDLEQVIGVSIGGEHRAYPIYMLSSREIVNDVVGGKPIAVTW